jgi:hypothetical protein
MRVRLGATGVIAALIGLVAFPSGGPAAATVARCHLPSGDRVLTQNRHAIVFDDYEDLWFCVRSTGVSEWVTSYGEGERYFGPPALELNGKVLGFAEIDDTGEMVGAFDVTRNGNGGTHRADIPVDRPGVHVRVGSLRVTSRRGLAWIECAVPGDGLFDYYGDTRLRCVRPRQSVNSVYRLDAAATKPVLIDRSRVIDPSSLRRVGSRIYWSHGKQRRTAVVH